MKADERTSSPLHGWLGNSGDFCLETNLLLFDDDLIFRTSNDQRFDGFF